MLNWKQYNILTLKEQKEYDWRFRDLYNRFYIWGINSFIMNMALIVIILVFTVVLSFTIPALEQYKTTMKDILKATYTMILIGIGYTVAVVFGRVIYFLHGLYQYYQWKKEIGFAERWKKHKI